MKCLRCGRCCFYSIIVIHPNSVRENLDLDSLKEEDSMFLDGSKKCPHLSWKGKDAVCAIYHYSWFKDTPCGRFTQVESSLDTLCRIGEMLRTNEESWKFLTKQII